MQERFVIKRCIAKFWKLHEIVEAKEGSLSEAIRIFWAERTRFINPNHINDSNGINMTPKIQLEDEIRRYQIALSFKY